MLYEFLYINGSSTKPGLRWTLKSTSLINTKNNSGLGDESLSFDSRCDWEMIFELASTTCFHQNHCIELLAHNEQGVGQTFTLGLVAYNEQGTPSVGLWIEWPFHGSNSIVKSNTSKQELTSNVVLKRIHLTDLFSAYKYSAHVKYFRVV